MATTAAVVVAKARRDVISHFMARNAVAEESAVPYQPERRIRRRMFERLQAAGVIHAAKRGGYWLDVPQWDSYSRSRRRRVGAIMAGAIAVAGGLVAILA